MSTPLQRSVNQEQAGGWGGESNITRSAWFDGSADYLSDTFAATQNQTAWTLSAWVRRPENIGGGSAQYLAAAGNGSSNRLYFSWQPDDTLLVQYYSGGSVDLSSTPVWRDTEWQHIRWVWDTDNASADDRMQVYVNNERVVFSGNPPAGLAQGFNTSGSPIDIGKLVGFSQGYFNGLMAQYAFISGDVTSLCGEYITTGTNGQIWAPLSDAAIKALVDAAGSNSFLLSSAIGDGTDDSANGNNFTPTSMSDAANGSDDTPSSPLPIFNPLFRGGGNVYFEEGGAVGGSADSTQGNVLVVTPGFYSGQHVLEFECTNKPVTSYPKVGLMDAATMRDNSVHATSGSFVLGFGSVPGSYSYSPQGFILHEGSSVDTVSTYTTNDRVAIEVDLDSDVIRWYKNGSLQSTTNTAGLESPVFFAMDAYTNADTRIIAQVADMTHTPTTGYTPPQFSNFEAPTVQGADLFNAVTYTGDGVAIGSGGQPITGAGFQPDLVVVKKRSAVGDFHHVDSSRGTTLNLEWDNTNVEGTDSEGVTGFDADGFTVGSDTDYNQNTATFASWCWKLAGGTETTNNAGSVTTTVQANEFMSLMRWQSPNASGAAYTVGHGLTSPDLVIVRPRDAASSWYTAGKTGPLPTFAAESGFYVVLDLTNAVFTDGLTSGLWTTSTFSGATDTFELGATSNVVQGDDQMLALAFKNVPGLCHVGEYTGNGSSDGSFVHTGFRPRWVLIKSASSSTSWQLHDTARAPYNASDKILFPDGTFAEQSSPTIDILANGFKCRGVGPINSNGTKYMCIVIADVASGSGLPPIPGR